MRSTIRRRAASKDKPACTLTQSKSSTSGNCFVISFCLFCAIILSITQGIAAPIAVNTITSITSWTGARSGRPYTYLIAMTITTRTTIAQKTAYPWAVHTRPLPAVTSFRSRATDQAAGASLVIRFPKYLPSGVTTRSRKPGISSLWLSIRCVFLPSYPSSRAFSLSLSSC